MKVISVISSIKNAMPWTLRRRFSAIKHHIKDRFLSRINQNRVLRGLGKGKTASLIVGGPSINNMAKGDLPVDNVFILNHFWLHNHYEKINSGYHCISDHLFLHHPRIRELSALYNPNLTFVTTKRIRRRLRELVPKAKFIELNYSASRPIYFPQNPLATDLTHIMQTGATVAADFALPMINYMSFGRLEIMGFDLDYGPNVDKYAYDVKGAIFTDKQYLENIWPGLAYTSIQRWISELQSTGMEVSSLTPTRLDMQK